MAERMGTYEGQARLKFAAHTVCRRANEGKQIRYWMGLFGDLLILNLQESASHYKDRPLATVQQLPMEAFFLSKPVVLAPKKCYTSI